LTDETIVNSNDIPPVPQLLLRSADRHHVQITMTDMPDADQTADEGAVASPSFDLSEVDLLAERPAEVLAESADIVPPPPDFSADVLRSPARGYSATDLVLFKALTGYNLDTRASMPRAIDDGGNRARIMDRLFTTLAEEAFGLADRRRRTGSCPNGDLTVEDLSVTLGPMRRVAAAIGSRGLIAFDTLEAAVTRLKTSATAERTIPDTEAVAA
jgi:hypothetical protein